MFFTQDDYRKIEEWLRTRTAKDSEFPNADPLRGNENVPIIQDGKNKTLTINELVRQVALMELPDFFNVTAFIKKGHLCLEQAVCFVPVEQRKLGLTITFHSAKGHWLIYQFKGTSLNQWSSLNYWRSPIEEALKELVSYPDEEDITGVRDGDRTFLKLKDKSYNPEDFSGKGRIILRKNPVGTEACSIDDEDHLINILTQDMIREENTIYIVQYDFDLDGKVISIPKGCILWFQGGSINNGTVYLQETAILGAFKLDDVGSAKLFGKFNTGQVMTFTNDNRQELKWWNGEEWALILDITDYNEIKSIINNLIEQHNADIADCRKYIEDKYEELNTTITNLSNTINNIENIIEEKVESYITNNVVGTASVTVNGSKYTPDSQGNITLPDYPKAGGEAAKETLTIKYGESVLDTYDGTEEKTITIPVPVNTTAEKVANKLKFTGAVIAEYDGSQEVSVNIPSGSDTGSGSNFEPKTLTIKDASGEDVVAFNAKEDKEVQFKKIHVQTTALDVYDFSEYTDESIDDELKPQDIDLLKNDATIDLSHTLMGNPKFPIPLLCSTVSRTGDSDNFWGLRDFANHPLIECNLKVETEDTDSAIVVTLKPKVGALTIFSATATLAATTKVAAENIDAMLSTGGIYAGIIGIRCAVVPITDSEVKIYMQGMRLNDGSNLTVKYDGFDWVNNDDRVKGFNLVVYGCINL